MATVAGIPTSETQRRDMLSGTPRAHSVDRWIFVGMAAWFIAITLAGFVPDSLMKIGMVRAGARPPFPLVLHMHALLMGSFLLVLLAQATLMATGRKAYHMQLGIAGYVLAALLVAVGFVLVPTMYAQVWNGAQSGPPGVREALQAFLPQVDNIMLLQLRIGFLFPIFMAIAFRARGRDSGMHKRMIFLATAMAIEAAIARITWLPSTMPASPLSSELFVVLAVTPLFAWDVIRNRRVHEAYWLWLAISIPFALLVHGLWGTEWWHQMAPRIAGVA